MLYLDFSFTLAMREALDRIAAAREQLDPYSSFPYEFSGEMRRAALAESVHYSTRIEGNTLTLEQVRTVLAGSPVNAPAEHVREVENYRDAMAYIQSLATGAGRVVTDETIRTIHFLVSKNLASGYAPGRYRTDQNFVVDRVTGRRVFFPPPPDDVAPLMREFVQWLNSRHEYPPAVKAALAHLNLVAIHPFTDGNGRTARVVESLVMHLAGFRSQTLVSLEAYYGRDQQGYYAALASTLGARYSPPKDVTVWLEYHLQAHTIQAEAFQARIERVVAEMTMLTEALADVELTQGQLFALWAACQRGSITNREHREVTGRSSLQATADFNALVERGMFRRIGRGRSTAYVLTQAAIQTYLDILSET